MEWRVLIVDDEAAADVEEFIAGNKAVQAPDVIQCIQCKNFSEAIDLLRRERFDLVILDLKDIADETGDTLAGEKVFEALKNCRFLPVIFHTGFAFKVAHLASPYVKVVTRSEWEVLRSSIKEIFDTKLPSLIRHIEEEQRKFMWESAEQIWVEDLQKQNTSDLAYLLARRLANSLAGDVVRSFLESGAVAGAPKSDKIHAVELYIYPPISKNFLFGDIFRRKSDAGVDYFVALTPSCDHAQCNADFVLLAKCKHLATTDPGKSAAEALNQNKPISGGVADKLTKLIRDNASPADRYKYLPGTSFLPDLLIDFQSITTIPIAALEPNADGYERIASLDSPFAESLQAKMTRYLGRIGTPDIDVDLALERFKKRITN